jgi:hypothetical protein
LDKHQRRLEGLKRARKLLRIYRSINPNEKEFFEVGGIIEKHLIHTRVPCSCTMCGNPRKYFKEKTRQEILSDEELKISYYDDDEL